MSYSQKCTIYHTICHPTPNTSKNVKFQLSRNTTKFDRLIKFREMNSTIKSVLSSEILKNSSFSIKITILPFFRKFKIFRVSHYTYIYDVVGSTNISYY